MIKKDLSDKDKEDWEKFLEETSQIPDKDSTKYTKNQKIDKFKFDFHGYSIESANIKVAEIINKCFENGFSELLFITGKGIHSQSEENVYISKEFSKLKNTIPEFIKNNPDLSSKVEKIKGADLKSGGAGALIIKLKKIIK